MKKVILLTIAVLWTVSGNTVLANIKNVKNPMKYAVVQSKLYAEGDANSASGWMGCKSGNVAQTLKILCYGTREILVHGGHMSKVQFECGFSFKQNSLNNFTLIYEQCN